MTDVAITGQDGVVFTFAPGEIQRVSVRIHSGAEQYTRPGSGPAATSMFDADGPLASIVINGYIFDTTAEGSRTSTGTVETVLDQVQWLMKQINGVQQPVGFTSNYASQFWNATGFSNTKVLHSEFDFDEDDSYGGSYISFTLGLLVGGY